MINQSGRVNLQALRTFVEVYRWRKLNAAAERLHLTPSAVSVLLRQFESAIGAKLFDRTTRALSPTEAAKQALPVAERILRDVAALESDFSSSEIPQGRVSIAVTPTVALTLMPDIMRTFEQAHPQIRVLLIDGESSQFVPRILDEEVDFGVGAPGQALGDLVERTLVQDYLNIACTQDHPLAQRKRISWSDLAQHDLISVKPGYGIRGAIDDAAAKAGVRLRFRHEVSMLTTALAMTSSGLGASIVPGELVARSGFSQLIVRRIERPLVIRNISVVTKRNRTLSDAANLFVSHLHSSLSLLRATSFAHRVKKSALTRPNT